MNVFQNPGVFQKPFRICIRAVGFVVTIVLVALLILAWMLTGTLFRWGVYLCESCRKPFAGEMKERSNPYRPTSTQPGLSEHR
jgi:hypothetical protein